MDATKRAELEEIVREAGRLLMQKWPGGPAHDGALKQERKADGSIVTEADFASNELIVSGLQRLFPGDAILSEEIPRDTGSARGERLWIIDPLDGTAHFADGRDDFSILVGLSARSQMEFGIMYFPARDQFVIGQTGKPTSVNAIEVAVSGETKAREGSIYIRNFQVSAEYESLVYPQKMDSGMAMLSVCDGTLDGAIMKMTTHKEWDVAAPSVVIEGAGGRVSDRNGSALQFDRGEVYFDYFVASNGKCHDQLLAIVEKAEAG